MKLQVGGLLEGGLHPFQIISTGKSNMSGKHSLQVGVSMAQIEVTGEPSFELEIIFSRDFLYFLQRFVADLSVIEASFPGL